MASMKVNGLDEYMMKMKNLNGHTEEILKEVVREGANPIADAVRNNIKKLPSDPFRKLKSGEEFGGISDGNYKDLSEGLGVAKATTRDGRTTSKVGFEGYGSYPTKAYPKGIPNALLARSIESGSSVRKKTPFMRSAANSAKAKSVQLMAQKYEELVKIYAL